jgi:hypothetical protein
MTAPLVINRKPTLVISSRGSEIPGVLLEDCSWHYGYDKRVAEASFLLERVPSWLDFWAPITLAAGATDATTEVRFSGYLYDFPRFGFGPRKHAVDCRGPLIKADTALVQDEAADPDVPGMDLSGFTAAAQTVAVLDECGLAAEYDLANNPNVWKRNESGLSFLKKRDEVELGFWLVETLVPGRGLRIVRHQVTARPRPIAATVTLTEGTDGNPPTIDRSSTASHSTSETVNRWVITGYDPGSGPPKVVVTASHPRPVPGVPFISRTLSSNLIEKQASSDSGGGLACDTVGNWKIDESNEIQLKAEITTPVDYAFNITEEVGVYSPDRLQVAQTMWCRSVRGSVDRGSGFQQKLSLRAPAAIGAGGTYAPVSFQYVAGSSGAGAFW